MYDASHVIGMATQNITLDAMTRSDLYMTLPILDIRQILFEPMIAIVVGTNGMIQNNPYTWINIPFILTNCVGRAMAAMQSIVMPRM